MALSLNQKILNNSTDEEILTLINQWISEAAQVLKKQEGDLAFRAGAAAYRLGDAKTLMDAYMKKKYPKDANIII